MKKLIAFVFALLILTSCGVESTSPKQVSENEQINLKSKDVVEENSTEETIDNIPREYRNALKSAKNYISMMPMSKKGLYNQLTSEFGDSFPADAAQYAIDNLEIDYKEQALKSAKNYISMMPMSKKGLYNQLTSDFGDKFTEEEAQYAVDNLEVDYREQALKAAKNYQGIFPMSNNQLKRQLMSDAGDKFTEEEAQYAIDNLDN